MKTKTLALQLIALLISAPLMGQDIDMTKSDIEAFKDEYNTHYDQGIESARVAGLGMLSAGTSLEEVTKYCEKHREISEEITKELVKDHPKYYAMVGSLSGSGDGKREGCLMAVAEFKHEMAKEKEILRRTASVEDKTENGPVKIQVYNPSRKPSSANQQR